MRSWGELRERWREERDGGDEVEGSRNGKKVEQGTQLSEKLDGGPTEAGDCYAVTVSGIG